MDLVPVELFAPTVLSLQAGGRVHSETPPRMSADADGWSVAMLNAETSKDVHGDRWEVHPAADEALCVLSGSIRLILRGADGASDAEHITLGTGTACIVPRGRWHRLELDGPAGLMSVTMHHGTRLEPRA
jgi:mannose-6-phosphate isomerase-like protein (cupin superfamily)